MRRPTLLALSALLLAGCSSSASPDTTAAGSAVTTTTATASPSSTAPATTTTTTLTGTQREVLLASINGTTLAALKLNTALLAKAGWSTIAPVSGPTTTAPTASTTAPSSTATSSREASVLLSVLGSSAAPRGYKLRAYGSAGVVDVWDGTSILAKELVGLVEYIEIAADDSSVCLRPSIDGSRDPAQAGTDADAYRALPIGELVMPRSPKGWIIMLRIAEPDACRTALDTMNAAG